MGNYQNTRHHKGPRELVTGGEWIYGRNPVEEALAAARRTASEIVLPPAFPNEDDQIARIRAEAQSRRLMIRTMDRDQLDRLTRFGHHQGVALKTTGYPYVGIEDIVRDVGVALKTTGYPYVGIEDIVRDIEEDENALVIVLDHLEDPQNVGAILRTAAAVGATGVVIPEDRACGITPAAVRASAGGAEHIKVAHVVNLPRAIEELKEAGLWFTGLDWGEDAKNYTDIDFKGRVGLVVGAEGNGISRLVREKCDFIAVLPMPGGFESLNAATAASVAMYEILMQRGKLPLGRHRFSCCLRRLPDVFPTNVRLKTFKRRPTKICPRASRTGRCTGTTAVPTPRGRYGRSSVSPAMSRFLQKAKAASRPMRFPRMRTACFSTMWPLSGARTLRQRP